MRHKKSLVAAGVGFAAVITAFGVQAGLGAPPSPPSSIVTVDPVRILDTRIALGVPGTAPVGANSSITVQVTGQGGVPVDATGVVLNLTGTGASVDTFITATPTGSPRSTTSVLNVTKGQDIANTITVGLGTGGQIDLFNNGGTVHLVADVTGYLLPATSGTSSTTSTTTTTTTVAPTAAKFVDLDVTGAGTADGVDTALFSNGFGANAGLRFSGTINNSASWHFVLPPDYTSGAAITATLTWHTSNVSCGVGFRANYTSVTRTGITPILGGSASSGLTDPTPTAASATANVGVTSTFSLTTPNSTVPLLAGDSFTFGIFRSVALPADTCAGDAYVDSLVIRYG